MKASLLDSKPARLRLWSSSHAGNLHVVTLTTHRRPVEHRRVFCAAEDLDTTITSSSPSPQPLTPSVPTPKVPPTLGPRQLYPASSWPRPASAPRTCPECGGSRLVPSPEGPVPCPTCLSWRRRPDYQPTCPLLSMKDVNLSLEGSAKPATSASAPSPLGTPPKEASTLPSISSSRKDAPAAAAAPLYSLSAYTDGSSSENDQAAPSRRRQKGQMTEEKRLAIKQAMLNRGPLSKDHKRRIASAMRQRHASDPQMRQAGKPKRCSVCGGEGHNKKTCPEMKKERKEVEAVAVAGESEGEIEGAGGEEQQQQQLEGLAAAPPPPKGIVIEEEAAAAGAAGEGGGDGIEQRNASISGAGNNGSGVPLQGAAATAAVAAAAANGASNNENVDEPPQLQPIQPPLLRSLPGSAVSLTEDGSLVFPLPTSADRCVSQAVGAVLRAWDDGIRRQSLELLLPQPRSDADGWPGGIRQQFRAALPMMEQLLRTLKRAPGLEGRITAEWLDEGDRVGAWQSERLAAVVFPTADTLPAVQRIDDALSGQRLMLCVNPQWQPAGQIVSDFGFGSSRRSAERFVDSLEEVYYLRRVRVLGDEIRVLRCFPGSWQVHYVRPSDKLSSSPSSANKGMGLEEEENEEEEDLVTVLSIEPEKPTYQRLLELLKGVRGSRAGMSWFDRALEGPSRYEGLISGYDEGGGERDIVTGELLASSGGEKSKQRR